MIRKSINDEINNFVNNIAYLRKKEGLSKKRDGKCFKYQYLRIEQDRKGRASQKNKHRDSLPFAKAF